MSVKVEYHWLPDCGVWMFLLIDDTSEDDIKHGSEETLEACAARALKARKMLANSRNVVPLVDE